VVVVIYSWRSIVRFRVHHYRYFKDKRCIVTGLDSVGSKIFTNTGREKMIYSQLYGLILEFRTFLLHDYAYFTPN